MDEFTPHPPVPGAAEPALEDLYDDAVLARIEGAGGRPAQSPWTPPDDDREGRPVIPRYPVARRVGGALLAGVMLGVAEVLEPERQRHHIIDYVPDVPNEDEQLVTFHMVPGDPRASRLVVRPWLLERFRARRATGS